MIFQVALQMLEEVARPLTKSIEQAVEGKYQVVDPLKPCRLVDEDVLVGTKFGMDKRSGDVRLSTTET